MKKINIDSFVRITRIFVFSGCIAFSLKLHAYCYVNSESHLPSFQGGNSVWNGAWIPAIPPSQTDVFASCGPSDKNSDLKWTPNQAARRALFNSPEVQNTAIGCESYGHLLKAECNPDFPVLTIYIHPQNYYKIESFIVARDAFLNASNEISVGTKSYLQGRLKVPSGDWSNPSFLNTIILSEANEFPVINIIEYVKIMNLLFNKYPTMNYRAAYIDFINGDFANLKYNVANYELAKKNSIMVIINTILNDGE